MRFFTSMAFRLRALLRRDEAERELRDELQFHIQMDADALRAAGMPRHDAEREARRRFGSMTAQAERARDGWGVSLAYEFAADARHALRQMRRRPAYSGIVTLTLGLGIGATVALFSVVSDLLIRSLPYRAQDQVHVFWSDYNWTGMEYDFVRERAGVFDHLAAFSTNSGPYQATLTGTSSAELLTYVVSTPTLFDVLGTPPAIGRAFSGDDDRPGAAPVVVISDGLWRQDLGGDAAVIGRRIQIDGEAVTVVGVMPAGFYFPTPEIRAWRPLQLDAASSRYANVGHLTLVGRARADAATPLVQSEIDRIAQALGERFTYPEAWDKTREAHAIPIRTYLLGDVRGPLLLLLAAVAMLLVIACANTAALILARTSDRAGEMAVRSALGAGRTRLARQVVAESLVLSLIAALAGVAVAVAGFRVLVSRLPLQGGFGATASIGWVTFAAAFVLALAIAALVSVVPFRDVLRRGVSSVNRERSSEGLRRGTRRFHSGVIAVQVSLAVLLLVGATLLIRSVERIRSLNPGFDARGVVTFTLVAGERATDEGTRAFFRDLVARVSSLPGVTAAGLTNRLPIRDGGFQGPVLVEGRPDLVDARRPNSLYRLASPGFFDAMGMRLVEGRAMDSTDVGRSAPVGLVSESFARRMWPNESAIGKRVTTAFSGSPVAHTIVGVVAETRLTNMTGEIPFALFVPMEQHAGDLTHAVLVVRTSGSLAALLPAVRHAAAELDPRVAVSRVETMEKVVAAALAQPLRLRFFLTVFAALALVLGVVGVYGVVSYAVARRRTEFAIRMALGAPPSRVLSHVVRHGLAPVAVGVAAGLGASLLMAGVVSRFLYDVAATDAMSLAAAGATLLAAGTLASLVPAFRAGRTSPADALRAE